MEDVNLDPSIWTDDGIPDFPNELLNISDHSDCAMESTSDLIDWSSLFSMDDSKNVPSSDDKMMQMTDGQHAEDYLSCNNNNTASPSSLTNDANPNHFPSLMSTQVNATAFPHATIQHQQPTHEHQQAQFTSDLQKQFQLPFNHQNQVQLQTASQLQPLSMQQILNPRHQQQQIVQQIKQIPQQLFIQPQQPIQQILQPQLQMPQQQQQLQQQHIRISFQPTAQPAIYQPSQQIILQQNPQQILLQPSQFQQQQTQVIIAPSQSLQTQQQQICISSGQKMQLLQQPQQMLILNGNTSNNNFIDASQLLLAPVQQTQQHQPIVLQHLQPQQPSLNNGGNQTMLVQIGGQFFQIQQPMNDNKKCVLINSSNNVNSTTKNNPVRISAKKPVANSNSIVIVENTKHNINPCSNSSTNVLVNNTANKFNNTNISNVPLMKNNNNNSNSHQVDKGGGIINNRNNNNSMFTFGDNRATTFNQSNNNVGNKMEISTSSCNRNNNSDGFSNHSFQPADITLPSTSSLSSSYKPATTSTTVLPSVSQQQTSAVSIAYATPVAKVRPLDCQSKRPGELDKSSMAASDDSESADRDKLLSAFESRPDLREKVMSALERMTPHQRRSFLDASKSVLSGTRARDSSLSPNSSSSTQSSYVSPASTTSLSSTKHMEISSSIYSSSTTTTTSKSMPLGSTPLSQRVLSCPVTCSNLSAPTPSCKISSLTTSFLAPNHIEPSSLSTLPLSSNISCTTQSSSSSSLLSKVIQKQPHFAKDFLKLSVEEKFKIHLMKDQKSALNPDAKTPFGTLRDALRTLAPYHVFQTRVDDNAAVNKADELYETVSSELLERKDKLLIKCQQVMLDRSTVHHDSVEEVMLGRMFLIHEIAKLKEERKFAETDPDLFVPRPVLNPEEKARLYPHLTNNDDNAASEEEEEDDEDENSSGVDENKWNGTNSEGDDKKFEFKIEDEEMPKEEKHIIIKITHHEGTFTTTQAVKRKLEDECDKVQPIKIARIRLKRIDKTEVDGGVDSDRKSSDEFFQVVGNGSEDAYCNATTLVKEEMAKITPLTSKANGVVSNALVSKQSITAVVVPFHKQSISQATVIPNANYASLSIASHDASKAQQCPMTSSSPTAVPFSNMAPVDMSQVGRSENNVSEDDFYYDLFSNDCNKIGLNGNYNNYESLNQINGRQQPDAVQHYPSNFDSDCSYSTNDYNMSITPIDVLANTLHFQSNDDPTSGSDSRMFTSDSDDFLDSSLEVEMQSAIDSILSLQRTE